jgi:hypothetical protein
MNDLYFIEDAEGEDEEKVKDENEEETKAEDEEEKATGKGMYILISA